MFPKTVGIGVFVFLLQTWTHPLQAADYTEIVVFGDSLSDNGNVSTATFGLIPGSPYFDGRFSNGLVYADYLAQSFGIDHQPFLSGGTNYAFGGALTDDHTAGFLPSVITQVQIYGGSLALAGQVPDPNALHIVWAGGNNILATISDVAAAPDPGSAAAAASAGVINALQDIISMTAMLASIGVDQVMIPNLPDLGRIPQSLDGGTSAIGTAISLGFNHLLDSVLPLVSWIDVIPFDTFSTMELALDDPAAYGFTNVTEPCLTGGLPGYLGGGQVCADPSSYLFWDEIHPTTATHQFLAAAMAESLNSPGTLSPLAAVPEPGGWPLFVAGLALLAVRRKGRIRGATAVPSVRAR